MDTASSPPPPEKGGIVPAEPSTTAGVVPGGSITFVLARSALLAGLCRFIPVPLLDDYIERNVHRFMVASLLKRSQRSYHVTHVEPLYSGVDNWASGCLGWFVYLPLTLTLKLLKKVFKSVFVVLLIREAGLSMATALLLGHVFHRALQQGNFASSDDPTARGLVEEATLHRKAFDAAFAGTDRRVLAHLLAKVFLEVKRLPRHGARAVRLMFGRRYGKSGTLGEASERGEDVVERGVEEVQETLQQDEVKTFLADFEATFESSLAHQRALTEQSLEAHNES